MNNEIHFSENWNRKLGCICFTTIRLANPKKYVLGEKYHITLKGQLRSHPATILGITKFQLHQLTEGMARIDTSYSRSETIEIIRKMYKNKGINIDTAWFYFITLRFVESETITNQLSLLPE